MLGDQSSVDLWRKNACLASPDVVVLVGDQRGPRNLM